MSLNFKHFDPVLNQWIVADPQNPNNILTETLDNTLLEAIFPDAPKDTFSIGEIQSWTTPENLENHPDGQVLLLASGKRCIYGPPEYKETLDKILPDEKDKGAYGSLFIGNCLDKINSPVRVLIVDDDLESQEAGENGGILSNQVALAQVGDSHGKISPEQAEKFESLNQKLKSGPNIDKQPDEITRHVLQHRVFFPDFPGEAKIGKGTLAPKDLSELPYKPDTPPIDIIIPKSSFKGGTSKPDPGLYEINMWLGVKSLSQWTYSSTSEVGLEKDTLQTLKEEAEKLEKIAKDPRKVAEAYCKTYEKQKAIRQATAFTDDETETSPLLDSTEEDTTIYKILKADLEGGHAQLLESKYVKDKLEDYLRKQRLDVATGAAIEWQRASTIIPSKDLNDDQVCVSQFNYNQDLLGFRSPLLYEDAIAIQNNTFTNDILDPSGRPFIGVAAVSDEPYKQYVARREAEIASGIKPDLPIRLQTYSKAAAEDYDGDSKTFAIADNYPRTVKELREKQHPDSAHSPTPKLPKASFTRENGEHWSLAEIAVFMANDWVGSVNNSAKAAREVENEIEVILSYGTPPQKEAYIKEISNHCRNLLETENSSQKNSDKIPDELRTTLQSLSNLTADASPITPDKIAEGLEQYRQLIRKEIVPQLLIQNQIAVDSKKSSTPVDLTAVKQYGRLIHRTPNFIREKKQDSVYKNGRVLEPNGFSLKELNIHHVNPDLQQSELEQRPMDQFRDLFSETDASGQPTYTPAQKMRSRVAKAEFDRHFNYAKQMDNKRRSEEGPVLKCQTSGGKELEISNIGPCQHPLAFSAKELEIMLIPNDHYKHRFPHHKVIAMAQTSQAQADGSPSWKLLGTLSELDREKYNICQGEAPSQFTKIHSLKREAGLTESQCKLLFEKANQIASTFRASCLETGELLPMAAASWHLCTSPDNRSSAQKQQNNYKIQNFVFAAFGTEIAGQLKNLQFTSLNITGVDKIASIPSKEVPVKIEINRSLAADNPLYGKRLLYTQNSSSTWQEFGIVSSKDAQLPIGTLFTATFSPGETHTAFLTIDDPKISSPIKIGKISHCDLAEIPLTGQQFAVKIQKINPIKYFLKTEDKTIGELDKESIEVLQKAGKLQNGSSLNVTLETFGRNAGTHTIATTSKGNAIVARKHNIIGDFKDHFFSGESATVTIEERQAKPELCAVVEVNGEEKVLGIFTPNQKESKIALQRAFGNNPPSPDDETLKRAFDKGALEGLTFSASVVGNATTYTATINPVSVKYPETWTRQKEVAPTEILSNQTSIPLEQQQISIQKTASHLIEKLTFPSVIPHRLETKWSLASGELETRTTYGLTVSADKLETAKHWLTSKGIQFIQIPPDSLEIEPETLRGYGVLRMIECNIPPADLEALNAKHGAALDANISNLITLSPYHQKLEEIPALSQKELSSSAWQLQQPVPQLEPDATSEVLQTFQPKETLFFTQSDYQWEVSPGESEKRRVLGFSIDESLSPQALEWLKTKTHFIFTQVSDNPDVHKETERGYQVFLIDANSVQPEAYAALIQKYGEPLEATGQKNPYYEKLERFPPKKEYQTPPETPTSSQLDSQNTISPSTSSSSSIPSAPIPTPPISLSSETPSVSHLDAIPDSFSPLPSLGEQKDPQPTFKPADKQPDLEELRNWYAIAQHLNKPSEYLNRIVEVGKSAKEGQPVSEKAEQAMKKDLQEFIQKSLKNQERER